MKKVLIVLMFLMSFVSLSFSDMIRMTDGDYAFSMKDGKKVIITVYNDKMALKADNNVIRLDMKTYQGEYFYCNKDFLIYFDDLCTCVITKQKKSYILYNVNTCK